STIGVGRTNTAGRTSRTTTLCRHLRAGGHSWDSLHGDGRQASKKMLSRSVRGSCYVGGSRGGG
ncbi:unnamed protein product, partial [Pylaiella littoralis]